MNYEIGDVNALTKYIFDATWVKVHSDKKSEKKFKMVQILPLKKILSDSY